MSASSYTHGHEATQGSGGFNIAIDYGEGGEAKVTISGASSFKGILLYTSKAEFEGLPNGIKFKDECDKDRGARRTVTHTSPQAKSSVSVGLVAGDHTGLVVNAVVLKSFHEWYWLNTTLS